jgi:hypothetical protein
LDIEGNQNPEKERSAEMIRLDKIIEILKNTEGVEEKV